MTKFTARPQRSGRIVTEAPHAEAPDEDQVREIGTADGMGDHSGIGGGSGAVARDADRPGGMPKDRANRR